MRNQSDGSWSWQLRAITPGKSGIPLKAKGTRKMSCCWGSGLTLMAHTVYNIMQSVYKQEETHNKSCELDPHRDRGYEFLQLISWLHHGTVRASVHVLINAVVSSSDITLSVATTQRLKTSYGLRLVRSVKHSHCDPVNKSGCLRSLLSWLNHNILFSLQ